jgi:hypothetical protein
MCHKKHAIHLVAQAHPKGEDQMLQKVFVDHNAKLKNERSTAGFRLNALMGRKELAILLLR